MVQHLFHGLSLIRAPIILREYHRNVCVTILASTKNDRTNQTLNLLFLFGSTLWHCRKRTIMLINISLCCSDYIITTFNGARHFGLVTNSNPTLLDPIFIRLSFDSRYTFPLMELGTGLTLASVSPLAIVYHNDTALSRKDLPFQRRSPSLIPTTTSFMVVNAKSPLIYLH